MSEQYCWEGLLEKWNNRYNHDLHLAEYFFPGETGLKVNDFLGRELEITFLNHRECIHCHRVVKKTFQNGYCFPCTQKLAGCDFCVVKPSLCHYHQGTCRDNSWGETHCMIDHVVYLANSSDLKVGLSRGHYYFNRWIDQGAVQAIPFLKTKNRYAAGVLEELLKDHVGDKTNWRKMLQHQHTLMNLQEEKERLFSAIEERMDFLVDQFGEEGFEEIEAEETLIDYPVLQYPQKIVTYNLDEVNKIQSKLIGMKAQYLIFENGVMNLRKFTGYKVAIKVL